MGPALRALAIAEVEQMYWDVKTKRLGLRDVGGRFEGKGYETRKAWLAATWERLERMKRLDMALRRAGK